MKKMFIFISAVLSIFMLFGCDLGFHLDQETGGGDERTAADSRIPSSGSRTTAELSDYYYNYYGIIENSQSRVLDRSSNNDGNVYANSDYHKASNQQWLIMPLYIGSNLNYLVSRSNAGVLDVHSNQNVYVYNNYAHMGNNQHFRFVTDESNSSMFNIESPCCEGKYLDVRSSGGNLYNGTAHGGSNQEFYLDQLATLSAMQGIEPEVTYPEKVFNIDSLSNKLESMDASVEEFENVTLIGESYIPFVLIEDPQYSRLQQLRDTPYYRLKREQAWKKRKDFTFNPYSSVLTEGFSLEKGITEGSSTTTQETISTAWSIEGEAEYMVGDDAKNTIGTSFSENTETVVNIVDSYSKNTIETYHEELDFTGTTEEVRIVVYQLVDIYSLQRLDGTDLITSWEIAYPGFVRQRYYAESPVTIEKKGSTTYIKSSTSTFIDQIPEMTSNTSPSGTASCSSLYGASYDAWKAFDGNDASTGFSRWISDIGPMPQWLSYNFGSTKKIQNYYILPGYSSSIKDRCPKTFRLQGSNGSAWTTLDTRTGITWDGSGQYFSVSNPGNYKMYRLYIDETNRVSANTGVVSIRQLKLSL